MANPASELIAALVGSDPRKAKRAEMKLGSLGTDDAHLLEGLLAGLGVEHGRARLFVLVGIGGLVSAGVRAPSLVERLIRVLKEEPAFGVRQAALSAIGKLGADAAPACEAVVHALKHDPEPFVRSRAAQVLGDFGTAAAPAVGRLLDALEGKDADVHDAASISLRLLGPVALAEHEERLRRLAATHPDEFVRDQLDELFSPDE